MLVILCGAEAYVLFMLQIIYNVDVSRFSCIYGFPLFMNNLKFAFVSNIFATLN